jgi:hypothetical protein
MRQFKLYLDRLDSTNYLGVSQITTEYIVLDFLSNTEPKATIKEVGEHKL